MHGAFFLASANMSLTLEAPTPTNISTKSEPEIVKNGTPASPATALASRVLPVPGGPTNSAPVGILAPKRVNLEGSSRNSTTSTRSSLAASTPATSSNVTRLVFSVSIFALDLPKLMAPPRPPPCIERKISIETPIINNNGRTFINMAARVLVPLTFEYS